MNTKSLKIKNQSYYYWNDIIFIDDFDKIRFSSDIDLPLGTLIKFEMLIIVIRCII